MWRSCRKQGKSPSEIIGNNRTPVYRVAAGRLRQKRQLLHGHGPGVRPVTLILLLVCHAASARPAGTMYILRCKLVCTVTHQVANLPVIISVAAARGALFFGLLYLPLLSRTLGASESFNYDCPLPPSLPADAPAGSSRPTARAARRATRSSPKVCACAAHVSRRVYVCVCVGEGEGEEAEEDRFNARLLSHSVQRTGRPMVHSITGPRRL